MSSFKQLKERRDARQIGQLTGGREAKDEKEIENENETKPSAESSESKNGAEASHVQVTEPTLDTKLEGNEDVHVKLTASRGRGLFWCPSDGRRLGRGSTILRLEPEMTVPTSESLRTRCHRCFSTSSSAEGNKPLQRCSGCKTLHYCSAVCQRADWPSHRPECKAIQMQNSAWNGANSTFEPGTTMRMLGRLVWERQRREPEWWQGIDKLQSNRESVSDPDLVEVPLRLAQYVGASIDGEQLNKYGFRNAGDILDLISRVSINTFATYSSDLTAVGISLSTQAAMLNHSCVPNVAVVYPNGPGGDHPMHIVAIRDVEAGEELTTFYIDVADPYALRQENLQSRYGFQCRCDMCKKSEVSKAAAVGSKKRKVDPREAIWCGRQNCTGWVALKDGEPSGLCTKCRQECSIEAKNIRAILDEGKVILSKVKSLMSQGNSLQALDIAKPVMKDLARIQPPSAYPLLGLLCQLQTALVISATASSGTAETAAYFEEAVRFHLLSVAGMQASNGSIYCEGHPVRAITLATLSTLLIREVVSPEETAWHAEQHSTSEYLSKVPSIPPVGMQRDQAGVSLKLQAINELKIAYGLEGDGGEPGRRLIDQVREWKDNESMLAMRRQ